MVYDALHNVIIEALDGLDPSFAQQDFTVKDVTASGGDSVMPRILEALYSPPMLVERRVVVIRDAQSLLGDEVENLVDWIAAPTPGVVLVGAVVGPKSHKLVKAATDVIDVNVGSRSNERVSFVESKMAEYRVVMDRSTAQKITDRIGDDVARVDGVARTLQTIYGTAPLNFAQVEPYLGDAGDVPEWDLTDALDRGDATSAIKVARRMLDSKGRSGLQIVNMVQRHYLRMARLEGSGAHGAEEAGSVLGIKPFPAGKALQMSQRLGGQRIATAVHWIADADVALKGAMSFGGKNLDTDLDATELTVIEILVGRLARLTMGARRR